ncbi:hypothetical protein BDN70DRAFT_948771 [Pholiota conissans]|uniref:Uncharacterized protein n=1 Tax=Pholiota conissans TaxID=109636 RepID=A0A9P6CZ04_9AGAR|nr:hypothetical protein BDN70DRAFT_948771 [Pholiota conissans]
MRWTFQWFILIHLLLTIQCIARPITSDLAEPSNIWRRNPSPSGRKRAGSNSSRGSSKKRQKQKAPPKDPHQVKAKQLKNRNYRKTAIEASSDPSSKWSGVDADHILEAQIVSNYLNMHRNGQAVGQACMTEIQKHMNSKNNLMMLKKEQNQHKAGVVAKLMHGHDPEGFKPDAKDAIKSKDIRNKLLQTASNIDKLFQGNAQCSHIHTPNKNGIHEIAVKMVNHAQNKAATPVKQKAAKKKARRPSYFGVIDLTMKLRSWKDPAREHWNRVDVVKWKAVPRRLAHSSALGCARRSPTGGANFQLATTQTSVLTFNIQSLNNVEILHSR